MSHLSQSFIDLCFLYACLQSSNYSTIDFNAVGRSIAMSAHAAQANFLRLSEHIETTTAQLRTTNASGRANTTFTRNSLPRLLLEHSPDTLILLEQNGTPTSNTESKLSKRGHEIIDLTGDEDDPPMKKHRTAEPTVSPRASERNSPAPCIKMEEHANSLGGELEESSVLPLSDDSSLEKHETPTSCEPEPVDESPVLRQEANPTSSTVHPGTLENTTPSSPPIEEEAGRFENSALEPSQPRRDFRQPRRNNRPPMHNNRAPNVSVTVQSGHSAQTSWETMWVQSSTMSIHVSSWSSTTRYNPGRFARRY